MSELNNIIEWIEAYFDETAKRIFNLCHYQENKSMLMVQILENIY